MRSALLLAAVLNGLAFNVLAQTNPGALTTAPAPVVPTEVVLACLPVQYRTGSAAYKSCIEEQLALREPAIQADSAKETLASLQSSDDTASTDSNTSQLDIEQNTAAQAADSNTNQLDTEQNTTAPEEAPITNTASTRPRFITPPIGEISQDSLPSTDESEIDLSQLGIKTYKKTETEKALELLVPAPITTEVTPSANIETIDSANQPDAQSSTEAEDSVDGAVANDATPAEQFMQLFGQFKTLVVDTFNGLSQQGKLLIAVVIAMPIALWFLLSGRGRRHSENVKNSRKNLKSRVMTRNELQEEYERAQLEPISSDWALEADSLFDDTPGSEHAAIAKPKRKQDSDSVSAHREEDFTAQISRAQIDRKSQHLSFADWLRDQDPTDQLSLCIEFLMYWMAFGDERYDPDLKRRIFQTPNLSKHDIIKRWVLKEDVRAFADVIDWLQKNTTRKQKEQIVRLLMALLINGEKPTPLQTTLLRFLSDVFYLENPTLETMFKRDFGSNLPAMPRVDRLAWWSRQSVSAVSLWDTRAMLTGDEFTRHAAQLGVNSDARAEQVEAAYELAIARCNPERFDHLSEREHQLIASRRSRLLQSHDELMEVLA